DEAHAAAAAGLALDVAGPGQARQHLGEERRRELEVLGDAGGAGPRVLGYVDDHVDRVALLPAQQRAHAVRGALAPSLHGRMLAPAAARSGSRGRKDPGSRARKTSVPNADQGAPITWISRSEFGRGGLRTRRQEYQPG